MARGICKNRFGERHGSVVVQERAGSDKAGNALWNCLCDCGKTVKIRAHLLKRTRFCSKQCLLYKQTLADDITGQKFGRLTAVKRVGFKGKHAYWEFECECGETTQATATNCKTGIVKSCGCLGKESRIKHGRSGTRAYKTERYQAYISAKRRSTPMSTQCPKVAQFYRVAKYLTRRYGKPYEVDHIIPLQGKLVSGLHVAANLQILTRSQNRRKSQTFRPDDIC